MLHRPLHLPETVHRDDEAEFVGRDQRPGRGVQQSDEAAPALPAVLPDGKGHDAAAARRKARRDGIVGIVVVKSPGAEPRQDVGRGKEEHPLHPVERGKTVHADEVQKGFLRRADIEAADVLPHLPRSLLVVLDLRDKTRNALLHGGEGRIETSAAAQHVVGAQRQRPLLAHTADSPDHAAGYLPDLGNGFVTIPEDDGQRRGIAQGVTVSLQKRLNHDGSV